MSLTWRYLLTSLWLSICVLGKQVRHTDPIETMQQFPVQSIPSAEYQPVYGGSPDQDLSAESIGIEFEDSIIRSMLQIVDVKFNTLSTRMLSMERGINSLQVYLSRQFRHVTKNLQAVNIVMNSLHAEVSHVDMETRSVRNSILALNKEFLDYRNRNLGVFRELPRASQKKVPVDSTDDSYKIFNQTRHTAQRDVGVEINPSTKPVLISSFRSSGSIDNSSLTIKDMHVYIEKGFRKLNQSLGKRFDVLQNISNSINTNVHTLHEEVTEINNTLSNSLTDQDIVKDDINYLKNMVEYLTEKQDNLIMDVSMIKEQTKSNKVLRRTRADQVTQTADGSKCATTNTGKDRSLDLTSEFEKLSEKLDMIDHRTEEFNENLVYMSDVLEASRNHTEHVVTLVEALSGSTIWIPHILREVKLTARFLNESINATHLVYKHMLGRRSDTPPRDTLPETAYNKSKRPDHSQNSQCKLDKEDAKLMRNQISRVEEILETFKNSSFPKPELKSTPEKTSQTMLFLYKKEVRENSTSGILRIKTPRGWISVCYDERRSTLVANIACTQLGFSFGSPLIVPNVLESNENIVLIDCQRKESNLDHCDQKLVSADHCKDIGLLGVFCVE